MRKVVVFNMVSVDGFFAGPNGEIDWHNVDAEFNDYAIAMLKTYGTLVFGRVTYDLMAGYWPKEPALADDPVVAGYMNSLPKIVFSKTMQAADWNNTQVVKEVKAEEVLKMKQDKGQDIAILGSGTIVQALTNLGLVDEYRLMVNPVILGAGKPLFKGIKDKLSLKLLETKVFKNGNVLLRYQPDKM